MVVIFDVVGTLFSLDKVRDRFRDAGIRPEIMELWFDRVLQWAMASTLAGKYTPSTILAHSALQQLFALQNIDEEHLDGVLGSLQEIEPWDDARECLRTLRSDGYRLVALTNSGIDDTERLLERSGLRKEFEGLYSADDAKACKPHHAPYAAVLRTMFVVPLDCCLVTAHEWDILGAQSVGMHTVYVNRLEKQWSFPTSPSSIVSSLCEVPDAISRQFDEYLVTVFHEL